MSWLWTGIGVAFAMELAVGVAALGFARVLGWW